MRWAIKHKSGRTLFVTSDEFIANNRRKMGWIVEEVMSECHKCNGTGMTDSGGTYPLGEPIEIECDCMMEAVKMTSREQFEEWAKENGMSLVYGDCDYVYSPTVWAWKAWQASRAVIEIQACPCPNNHGPHVDDHYREQINNAGLKVKK